MHGLVAAPAAHGAKYRDAMKMVLLLQDIAAHRRACTACPDRRSQHDERIIGRIVPDWRDGRRNVMDRIPQGAQETEGIAIGVLRPQRFDIRTLALARARAAASVTPVRE